MIFLHLQFLPQSCLFLYSKSHWQFSVQSVFIILPLVISQNHSTWIFFPLLHYSSSQDHKRLAHGQKLQLILDHNVIHQWSHLHLEELSSVASGVPVSLSFAHLTGCFSSIIFCAPFHPPGFWSITIGLSSQCTHLEKERRYSSNSRVLNVSYICPNSGIDIGPLSWEPDSYSHVANCLHNIFAWMSNRHLKLIISKDKFMIFLWNLIF